MYRKVGKRVIDLLVAILGLVLLSPLLLFLGIVLAASQRISPLFIHPRAGQAGEPFNLVKFRTMNNACDAAGKLLPDHERLTSLGKFIRALSLDELPQLFNVLTGDMSLVGPRPLPVKYLPRYSERQSQRHLVKPGITGWAQVNGRNNLSWEKKFEHDLFYVENCSFRLDMRILWLTFKKVLTREGINASAQNTMEEFTGNKK